ncbi:MAG TPA: chloride channel protein, partial [Polyangiaceae bacterium]
MDPSPPRTHATGEGIPATLGHEGAVRFWLAALALGVGTGLGSVAFARLLAFAQQAAWGPTPGGSLLEGVLQASPLHRVTVLCTAGALVGAGQLLLSQLTRGNGIDVTNAILFHAGRLPKLRTLVSATLSVVVVAMGASLGREGAPKQAGAVLANVLCDRLRLSDPQRQLLVACGSGSGLSAAYGVPIGGALFAMEVMRGIMALRTVLPALFTSVLAAGTAWVFVPNAPTYVLAPVAGSLSLTCWSVPGGVVAGLVSVGFVRLITAADRVHPKGLLRLAAPVAVLGAMGAVAIAAPALLGNGKDATALAFADRLPLGMLAALIVLRPLATALCLGSGAPGGLFTPSLSLGALLGALLGHAWGAVWSGAPPALCAVVG